MESLEKHFLASMPKKLFQPGLIVAMVVSLVVILPVSGCSDDSASEDPVATDTDTDDKKETEGEGDGEGDGEDDDDDDDGEDDGEEDDGEDEDEEDEFSSNTLPSNGRSVEVAGVSWLSLSSSGTQVIGLTSDGRGLSKVTSITTAKSYDLPAPESGKLFSLLDALHWAIGTDGVKILKDSYSKASIDAVTAVAFPTTGGFDADSEVIGVRPDVLVLKEGGNVSFFKDDGSVMTTALPAELSDVVTAGPIKGGKGYWAISTTKLAYFMPETGDTVYQWSDATDVPLNLPEGETVKDIYMNVEIDSQMKPDFDSYYYILTNVKVYSEQIGSTEDGSGSEVGSG